MPSSSDDTGRETPLSLLRHLALRAGEYAILTEARDFGATGGQKDDLADGIAFPEDGGARIHSRAPRIRFPSSRPEKRWRTPASAQPSTGNVQPAISQTAAPLSVSGKITAVAKTSFTLAVGGSQTSGAQQISQTPEAKSMTFMIDKNTTIEGKLKVNANAEVAYREDNGKNIAISVHVTA